MKPTCVGGRQSAVPRQSPDLPEIVQARLGDDFRHDGVTVEGKVCPKSCSQEDHIPDAAALVFQHMDIGAVSQLVKILNEFLKLLTVELVVAEHVHNGSIDECLQGPL